MKNEMTDPTDEKLLGLLEAAERTLHEVQWCRRWIESPLVPHGSSDRYDLERVLCELGCHSDELGRAALDRLLPHLPEDRREDMALAVGRGLIDGYYASLLEDFRREIDEWKRRDWSALRERGLLDWEEYRVCREEFPADRREMDEETEAVGRAKFEVDHLLMGVGYVWWLWQPEGRSQWLTAVTDLAAGKDALIIAWTLVNDLLQRMSGEAFSRIENIAPQVALVYGTVYESLPNKKLLRPTRHLTEVSAFASWLWGTLPDERGIVGHRLEAAVGQAPVRCRPGWEEGVSRLAELSDMQAEAVVAVSGYAAEAYSPWFESLRKEVRQPLPGCRQESAGA